MFPFFHRYPGTNLHEIDLDYVLREADAAYQQTAELQAWADEHQEEYEELQHVVDSLVNHLVDVIVPWDSSAEYPIYSIVSYQGTNYIALQDVPVGVMITNTEYWQPANTIIEQINAIGAVTSGLQDDMEDILPKQYYVTPENYGATGDGETDDTAALQAAVNSGQKYVMLYAGKNYRITDTIILPDGVTIDLNGATITSEALHTFFNFAQDSTATGYNGNGNITIKNGRILHGSVSFIHAENVLLENLEFIDALNDHIIEVCACKDFVIRGCTLRGMADGSRYEYINLDPCYYVNFPWLPETSVTFDRTIINGLIIEECTIEAGANTGYTAHNRAIGVHSNGEQGNTNGHTNIIIRNNHVRGFVMGIVLNDMDGVTVEGNVIEYGSANESQYGMIVGDNTKVAHAAISHNIFRLLAASLNRAIVVSSATTAEHLTIWGNSYNTSSNFPWNAPISVDNPDTQFDMVDSVLVFSGNSATPTFTVKPTQFNKLIIDFGANSLGTYSRAEIAAFTSERMQAGRSWKVNVTGTGGHLEETTVTITADGCTSSGQTIRAVFGVMAPC